MLCKHRQERSYMKERDEHNSRTGVPSASFTLFARRAARLFSLPFKEPCPFITFHPIRCPLSVAPSETDDSTQRCSTLWQGTHLLHPSAALIVKNAFLHGDGE